MKIYKNFLIVILVFFMSSQVFSYEWNFDEAHSEIRFKVKHIHTTVLGHFRNFKGKLFFNPMDPEKSIIDFTIDVNSVDTNNGKRDTHLKSGDFFDAGKFPEMRFISSKVRKVSDNRYVAEGMLKIKDVTKKVALNFTFIKGKVHPFMKNKVVAGVKSNLAINRLDYNVGSGKFLKLGVVGNEVNIEIEMEILRKK